MNILLAILRTLKAKLQGSILLTLYGILFLLIVWMWI